MSAKAAAVPVLAFSSPDDLASLVVGQHISVQIQLSGLHENDQLEALAATAKYQGSLLVADFDRGGSILPNPP